MKRTSIATAFAALAVIAGPLAAMHLSPDRRGEVLVYPYYTANDGMQTLITVVNSSDRGKAIALNIREGSNSRIVQRLYLYLAPHDIWTAAIFATDDNGPARLATADASCTFSALFRNPALPALANGIHYLSFSNSEYTGAHSDSGSDALARTREGHFEMIEMGEVVNVNHQSLAAITPGGDGVPVNCRQIEDAWRQDQGVVRGYWAAGDANADISVPTGGLYGYAAVVDVNDGSMLGFVAEAISEFSSIRQHSPPTGSLPDLGSAVAPSHSAEAEHVVHVVIDGAWRRLRYPADRGIDAVSALFMAEGIYNEYVTTSSLGADTEWLLSFPTKHHYTDLPVPPAIAPFASVFPVDGDQGQAPISTFIRFWDRNSQDDLCRLPDDTRCPYLGVRPPSVPLLLELNWAINVVAFNQETTGSTSILHSERRADLDLVTPNLLSSFLSPDAGQMHMLLHAPEMQVEAVMRPDVEGNRLTGLPVQAYGLARYVNSAVTPGVLANYAAAFRHQSERGWIPAAAQP